MTTILLNAVINPPLEIVHRSAQQLLIDREHFLPDGILKLVKLRGLWVYTRPFMYPQHYTALAPMNVLQNIFPGRLISRFGDVPWPPRSPDLSSCDFFLWGYLKGRFYTHKPRNLNELKDAIQQEVLTVDQQLLGWAMDDFKRRIENCVQEDVRHLNDIIFHAWIPNSNGLSWPLIL